MARTQKTEIEQIVGKYCNDIIKENIPSCMYVKKAVKRFLSDIKAQSLSSFDYCMDWAIVQMFYDFTKKLRLVDKNQYLDMLPWEMFIHANLLGWKNKYNTDKRRFRSGAVFVPRKNGKTTGIMYPLLLWDFLTTNSAESYYFEKDGNQSEKMFKDLKAICLNSDGLKNIINEVGTNIYYKNSRIAYFSSESVGIDGYKPSLAIIDEYFCFQNDKAVTAMRYGSRGRENGLVLVITTAGTDISLPAYTECEKAKKVLNGVLTDETYFSIIYGIDDTDDWKNERSYIKANPSIGAIIDQKVLEQDLQDALSTPSHQADYKAKTLNIWTNETSNWIPLLKWDTDTRNQRVELESPCYAALDLSSVNDFTAYTLCCKKNGLFHLWHKFYIPSEQVREKYRVENINIYEWIDKGFVTATPGPTVDYEFILNDIIKDAEEYDLVELAYDSWQSNRLIDELDEKIPKTVLAVFDQSLKQMAGPSKEYERLILEDKIIDPNPVMKWMISNAVIKVNVNGDYKPLKEYKSSTKRIDGVITSIMAIDRASANENHVATTDFNDVLRLFK